MKKLHLFFLLFIALSANKLVAQQNILRPAEAQPHLDSKNPGNVKTPGVCGSPLDHPSPAPALQNGANLHITNPSSVQATAVGYTESIHNAIAKWTSGSFSSFSFGTTAGSQNIRWGQGLNSSAWNTGGHSYEELRRSAAAMGTTFNIGDNFYLNLYNGNTLAQSIPLQFQWATLGLTSYNLTVHVETGFGVNGAVPFTATQAAKMQTFYDLVIPIIRSVYGPPSRSHDVIVINDSYGTGKNTYYNGPDWVSSSYMVNSSGDLDQPRLMIHELVHAWRGNVCISSDSTWHYNPTLSGFEEGCAEGVAIIVMDLFMAQYPNFFTGPEHKIHWSMEPGFPFEWNYDFQNHKQIVNADFWSSDIATGSHWLRYGMGSAAIIKIWTEDHNALKNFNAEYYNRMNANHTLIPERAWIVDAFKTVKPEMERTPMVKWMNDQRIFDCKNVLGKKLFMLSFTSLGWNAFQYDNRIHFMETHKNGFEWKWDSQDQAGLIEVPDYPQPNWSWTHQLNNTPGDISIVRDWNNTNTVAARAINNNSHWVNELPSPLNAAYVGVPLLGPYQGANPYYVGSVFTRDDQQDNCANVPGCGKRAWAIGNQPLYTTSSSLATMWPTPTMINGTGTPTPKYPQYLRYINDLTESGLFRFEIGFNDSQGPRVNDTYYRLLGNNFIDVNGIIGGIYSTTANQVDGKLYIEHQGYGAEPAVTISNNSFKITRQWTSILATQQQYMNGRTDVKYTVPGKVHAVYTSTDCSKKKIDFRTIGYGDGLYGTEMLLFNEDEMDDIIFTTNPNLTLCAGDPINLNVTNNFPDIFAGDPRVTYTWKDPSGATISSDTITSISSATAANAGVYTVDIGFFGCPVFQKTVTVTVGASSVLTLTAPDSVIACPADTIHLSINNAGTGATYSWTGPNSYTSTQQNPVITPATITNNGQYIVTVTVPGCSGTTVTGTDTIQVVVSNAGTFSLTPQADISICQGNTIQLNADLVTGAAYSWTGPNTFTSTQQNPAITSATPANSGQYIVTVTALGCGGTPVIKTDTILVVVNNSGTFNLSPQPDISICDGATLQLTTSAITGATYSWTGPNAFTSTLQNPAITPATIVNTGQYIVTVTATGCGGVPVSATDTIHVIVNSNGTLNLTPQPDLSVCQGATIQLTTNTITGATYNWTGPNTFTSSQQNPAIIAATAANAGQYIVTVSALGCGGVPVTATDTIMVAVQTNPTVNAVVANPTISVCQNATLNLSVNPVTNATYNWTGPGSFSSAQQQTVLNNITAANAGTYQITVSVMGCNGTPVTSTASVAVSIITNPAINIAPVSTLQLCPGAVANLSVNAITGATYSWTGPNAYTASTAQTVVPVVNASTQGDYNVSVHFANSCLDTTITAVTHLNIINLNGVTLNVSGNQVVCQNEVLNLSSTASAAPSSYNWTSPSQQFLSNMSTASVNNFSPADSGTYILTVNFGCPGLNLVSSIHVQYQDDATCHPESGYYIPTGFSPNGDGKNDMLMVYGNGIESMSLSIYDRWGTEVFFSNSQTSGWNGSYKGEELNTAVFAYRLSLTFKDKAPVKVSGNISLIR